MFAFARRARAEASRGFLGKLPWSAEFVRLNAHGVAARALDNWFQDALAIAAADAPGEWEARFDALDTVAYWCNFAAGERTLVGALRPGRDASGRRYPVSAFAAFDARHLERSLAVAPIAFDVSLRTAAQVAAAAFEAGDPLVIAAAMDELPTLAAADDPLHRQELWRFLDGCSTGELAALVDPAGGARSGRGLAHIAAALAEMLVPLRDTAPARLGWSLALPIALDAGWREPSAAFWLDLVDALLGRRPVRASWLLAGPRLVVAFRDPSPRLLAGLITGRHDAGTLLELAAIEPPASYGYAGRTLFETAASDDAPAARLVRAAESL